MFYKQIMYLNLDGSNLKEIGTFIYDFYIKVRLKNKTNYAWWFGWEVSPIGSSLWTWAVGGTVWGSRGTFSPCGPAGGSMSLGKAFRVRSIATRPACSVYFLCVSRCEHSTFFSGWLCCHTPTPWWTYSSGNISPPNHFFCKLPCHGVLSQTTKKYPI